MYFVCIVVADRNKWKHAIYSKMRTGLCTFAHSASLLMYDDDDDDGDDSDKK